MVSLSLLSWKSAVSACLKVLWNFRKSLQVTLHLSSLSGTYPVHSTLRKLEKLPLMGLLQNLQCPMSKNSNCKRDSIQWLLLVDRNRSSLFKLQKYFIIFMILTKQMDSFASHLYGLTNTATSQHRWKQLHVSNVLHCSVSHLTRVCQLRSVNTSVAGLEASQL